MDNCLFCKIVRGEIPSRKVYEDDLVYAFLDINPLRPVYRSIRQAKPRPARAVNPGPLRFVPFDGGIVSVGHQGRDFCFDNETPRHQVLLQPFELAQRLVDASAVAGLTLKTGL